MTPPEGESPQPATPAGSQRLRTLPGSAFQRAHEPAVSLRSTAG